MKSYGELLIFVLLFLTNLRVFFVEHARRDPLVSLSVVSFILSILQLISWGLDFFTGFAFILSTLVLLSNFHAIFRYSEHLYIDHYSNLMKVWAIVTSILSVTAIIFCLIFSPAELRNEDLEISETTTRMEGSFRNGFTKSGIFTFSNGSITKFETLDDFPKEKEVILFFPDKRSSTYFYKPYLQLLAQEGYTVFSCDFYSKDCKYFHSIADNKAFRRIFMVISSLIHPGNITNQREFYTYNSSLECKAVYSYVSELYEKNQKFILISDSMTQTAALDLEKEHSENIIQTICLNQFHSYKNPGYGMINLSDPLLYFYFTKTINKKVEPVKNLVFETKQILK